MEARVRALDAEELSEHLGAADEELSGEIARVGHHELLKQPQVAG